MFVYRPLCVCCMDYVFCVTFKAKSMLSRISMLRTRVLVMYMPVHRKVSDTSGRSGQLFLLNVNNIICFYKQ